MSLSPVNFNFHFCGILLAVASIVGIVPQTSMANPSEAKSLAGEIRSKSTKSEVPSKPENASKGSTLDSSPAGRVTPEEIERSRKRAYPGGRDEEDLKVLETLPEASRKVTERSIQAQVYKSIYNEELAEPADESEPGEQE